MVILDLNVTPTFCNEWPVLKIMLNDIEVYKDKITQTQDLKFYLDPKLEVNTLEIGMCDKKFGKNDVWDTDTADGKILKDRTLTLNTCTLDQVDIMDLLTKNKYHCQIVDQQPIYHPTVVKSTGTMWYNGTFFMTFRFPLMTDLTNQKWKKEPDNSISYFSNHTLMFHYEEELELLKEIEDQIDEIEKKLSS